MWWANPQLKWSEYILLSVTIFSLDAYQFHADYHIYKNHYFVRLLLDSSISDFNQITFAVISMQVNEYTPSNIMYKPLVYIHV